MRDMAKAMHGLFRGKVGPIYHAVNTPDKICGNSLCTNYSNVFTFALRDLDGWVQSSSKSIKMHIGRVKLDP